MIGAIAGDVIGSIFERGGEKNYDFPLFSANSTFTDDTVHTLAVAEAIQNDLPFEICIRQWSRDFKNRGYGGMMGQWIADSKMGPYNSFGNGSGMRVSPVGFAYSDLETVLHMAEKSALPTHNHPEGIRGAQAVAGAVFLANTGKSKNDIRQFITENIGYDLNYTISAIRPVYEFDVTCQGSIPESILCFLESTDVESAIRLAVSMGGDTDTMACMAGAIAGAFYKEFPQTMLAELEERLGEDVWEFVMNWCAKYEVKWETRSN